MSSDPMPPLHRRQPGTVDTVRPLRLAGITTRQPDRKATTVSFTWLFDDRTPPAWAAIMEARIINRLDYLMALVQVEQDDLNALDTALDEATQAITDRIQALVDAGTLPAADVSALQADVENLRGLAAPTPTEPPTE